MKEQFGFKNIYKFLCRGPKAEYLDDYQYLTEVLIPSDPDNWVWKSSMESMLEEKWRASFQNVMPISGLNYILDSIWDGTITHTNWYMGLVADSGFTAFSENDTSASHAGWVEDTNYTQPNRPELIFSAAANKSKTLSASLTFTGSGDTDIIGAFTISDNTKSGTLGLLISEGAFITGVKPMKSGYLLNATFTSGLVSVI